jgi:predicted MFS family arabinose efflux permease
MGLLGAMSAIGTALGPSLGGILIAWLGWRALFLVNVPLGILTFILARRYLPLLGKPKAASPSILSATFRDPVLGSSLATSALVSTVMMATLVVGPFHLAGALALDAARVGLVMSAGPVVVALMGVPAGRIADRFGAQRVVLAGLVGVAAGCLLLSVLPATLGIPGYVGPMIVMTAGYALFQTANNTAVMTGVPAEQRGVVSGMLNLSRNLGLVTGASVLGAVFAAGGIRITFAVAAMLIAAALAIAVASREAPIARMEG